MNAKQPTKKLSPSAGDTSAFKESSVAERNSKQGSEREKAVSGIFHLLLDFELYMKKQFKKPNSPYSLSTTVKSTRTVPKAVVGLSRGTVDLIFLLRRSFAF